MAFIVVYKLKELISACSDIRTKSRTTLCERMLLLWWEKDAEGMHSCVWQFALEYLLQVCYVPKQVKE